MEKSDYDQARELHLTELDRWEIGIQHHMKSEQLMKFLMKHDFFDYDDSFDWNSGGDNGDNGETLMYQMDAFFELQDINNNIDKRKSQ